MNQELRTDDTEASLRLEQMRLANEKLKLELAQLRKGSRMHPILGQLVPVVSALVAAAGFVWGVAQYVAQQRKSQEAAEREFMKPWLESQREIYLQALSSAAIVANSNKPEDQKKATDEFWRLYQGKMILVETKSVSGAMVAFGGCLGDIPCSRDEKNKRLRALATAMEDSLAKTAAMTFREFSTNQFKYSRE